jgi:hypothetical protein
MGMPVMEPMKDQAPVNDNPIRDVSAGAEPPARSVGRVQRRKCPDQKMFGVAVLWI